MAFVGNYVYVGQDYPYRNCQIQRFLDEGQAGLCTPQVVYTPPSDGCMPFISGVFFNGSLVFGNCAEFQNGTTRVVSSIDGINWNILTATSILSIEPRWNIFTYSSPKWHICYFKGWLFLSNSRYGTPSYPKRFTHHLVPRSHRLLLLHLPLPQVLL